MEQESTYVGIDVAKAQVDVAVRPTGQTWTITYDDAGVQELVSQLKTLEPALVLLEATGGLELPMVVALATAALPVVVVIPVRFETSRRPPGHWRRPIPWMRQSWPTSPTPFVQTCAL